MQSNLDIQREKIYEYLQKKYKRAVMICQQFIGHKNYNLTNHF